MAIQFSPEQEQRVQAVIARGSYNSVADVLEAALVSLEQRSSSGFDGTAEELETLLAEGLASAEMTEDEFWKSIDTRTNDMLVEYRLRGH